LSSLIEGYNYDIFISYRQKDNKGDRWVSKFVDALKTELEATFKEDVSVYFDENPHDRLQETHNVDKSLEGKLKCLILIPILSQTYCDPNSYAWEYEFLVFDKLAKEDHFGRDIRLKSGNVASRILPIRIHDLDQEDIKLFEKETGSVLRAIDFIFKTTTGVSRPLLSIEDHPNDNLNKTFYRDQINKVAHAIKEIILGMKTEPILEVKEKNQPKESFKEVRDDEQEIVLEKPAKEGKWKLLSAVVVLAILIITAILAYPKIFKRNSLEKLRSSGERISIAVMPFQNMTNDTIWNVWQDGIQNELINKLTNSEELRVRQLESISELLHGKGITSYASITPSVASTISQKLDANVYICGSIEQAGATIRVNAQLIDTKTKEALKSFQIESPAKEEIIFHTIDSLNILVKNYLIISKLVKEDPHALGHLTSTNSSEAYRCYMNGRIAFNNRDYPTAREWYFRAKDIDTNFVDVLMSISYSYGNQSNHEEAKKWCLKAYGKRNLASIEQKLSIDLNYATYFQTHNEEIKYEKQLMALDDKSPYIYYRLGLSYLKLFQYMKAIPEYEKSLEIYRNLGIKPRWIHNYTGLGTAYHKTGQYKKEGKLYKKAERDFPDDDALINRQAILSLSEGDTLSANRYIEKYISILKGNSITESIIASYLAGIYSEASVMDKAEEYYRQALSLEPENTVRINNLAYFLIDKDRNVKEGLELADRVLGLNPDDFASLYCKGWGLYKQGEYKEALEILQKSWDLRMKNAIYNHEAFLHIEAAKKAFASQKNN
jgi:tetratricopeptide (TPR) repeat protein